MIIPKELNISSESVNRQSDRSRDHALDSELRVSRYPLSRILNLTQRRSIWFVVVKTIDLISRNYRRGAEFSEILRYLRVKKLYTCTESRLLTRLKVMVHEGRLRERGDRYSLSPEMSRIAELN